MGPKALALEGGESCLCWLPLDLENHHTASPSLCQQVPNPSFRAKDPNRAFVRRIKECFLILSGDQASKLFLPAQCLVMGYLGSTAQLPVEVRVCRHPWSSAFKGPPLKPPMPGKVACNILCVSSAQHVGWPVGLAWTCQRFPRASCWQGFAVTDTATESVPGSHPGVQAPVHRGSPHFPGSPMLMESEWGVGLRGAWG